MKKIVVLWGLLTLLVLSACSFETYQCPAYSESAKTTKYGAKAQARYYKKHKL
ncbi:MAG TPA: hypothetical protein VFM90_12735 [Cyclobacteriaceae bacterium]|nr:hypothetical protein [Cyclobacteriaceae bacterium]